MLFHLPLTPHPWAEQLQAKHTHAQTNATNNATQKMRELSKRRTTPRLEMLSGKETRKAATVRGGGSTATPEKESNVTARYEKLLSKLR